MYLDIVIDVMKTEEKPCFDIKYGFFVVMGGLEVSIADIQHYKYKSASRGSLESGRLRLSVNGVLQLARLGYFIHIPGALIDDKSKADTLQKVVIIGQVLWMATQCIVRKVYGLPISLLEIHTMVHVFCALVMFVFWIKVLKGPNPHQLWTASLTLVIRNLKM
jgi:hypothetical protein